MRITLWKDDEIIKKCEVVALSHFHIARDYMLELDTGEILELSASVVKQIVQHELEEKE